MARFRDNAGIVAAIGEQKRYFGLGEQMDLVDRAPRRDMILERRTAKMGARISLTAIGRPSTV